MYITLQGIITIGGVLTVLGMVVGIFVKVVRFIDRQKAQDEEIKQNRAEREKEIEELRQQHAKDLEEVRREERAAISSMKKEQTLLVYGILACLKGLKEQGCNGPVTEAINKIEKHINQKAHE